MVDITDFNQVTECLGIIYQRIVTVIAEGRQERGFLGTRLQA